MKAVFLKMCLCILLSSYSLLYSLLFDYYYFNAAKQERSDTHQTRHSTTVTQRMLCDRTRSQMLWDCIFSAGPPCCSARVITSMFEQRKASVRRDKKLVSLQNKANKMSTIYYAATITMAWVFFWSQILRECSYIFSNAECCSILSLIGIY